MNIFVVGRNISKSMHADLLSEVKALTDIFPTLDSSTLWSEVYNDSLFAASISPSSDQISPRVYVARRQNGVTFYDGCLVDTRQRFHPWDAVELHKHWNELSEDIEGHYVAVNIDGPANSLAIQNDPLGVFQVYYVDTGDSWIISNNIRVLRNACKLNDWDDLGTSLFLGLGWASGDRTLVKGVKVFPPGEQWRWSDDAHQPQRIRYFSRTQLRTTHRAKLNKNNVESLALDLITPLQILGEHFGSIRCPITGGRDSRVMLALLAKGGTGASYFTGGDDDNSDVIIAKKVAERLALAHQTNPDQADAIIGTWDQVWHRLVTQRDGLVSLSCAVLALDDAEPRSQWPIHLYGIGGEIGRGYYYCKSLTRLLYLRKPGFVKKNMASLLLRSDELLTQNVRQESLAFVEQFYREALDDGFEAGDILDLFYAYERVRRWAATNLGTFWCRQDEFSPFCTRSFIKTAFSIPYERRFAGHIHYELLKYLTPELANVSFDSKWRTQKPWLLRVQAINEYLRYKSKRLIKLKNDKRKKGKYMRSALASERVRLLEHIRPKALELCMDQEKSVLWDYVDREMFEKLLSNSTDPQGRFRRHEVIFDILTLFYYEASR